MRLRLIPYAATLLLAAIFARPAAGQAAHTTGVFTDRAGKQHPWSITPSHALFWDSQAYVPVGGAFAPHYLAEGATEENWQRDVKGLEELKKRGVHDLIINPVVSAAAVQPAAWQRLIDYLETNGFRYGIGFGEGISSLLTGTVVKPGSYRVRDINENLDVSWSVSDTDTARFVIAEPEGTVLKTGDVRVQNGLASVRADSRVSAGAIGLLYPHKVFKPSREGYLPDIWSGFDLYRDRLLATFTQVKFGPGLHFFLDPLAHSLGILGELEYIVPDSPAFRLEWEAFLTQRYPVMDDLLAAWAFIDRDIKDHKHAAALMPLWAGRRGVAYMVDPTRNKLVEVDPFTDKSKFWADLRECRNNSVVYYMNSIADFLKREIADVPVVYTYTQQHRMFTNPNRKSGFDGIGIAAYARGTALVTGGADSAYSQCNESQKTMWLVVTETLDTASANKDKLGYSSQQALFQDLDWLRTIGAKGFFVNGFQVLPEAANRNVQLLNAPDQIDWLKQYDDKLHRESDVAMRQPRTLPYPSNAAGLVHSGPIGNGGVWWVPSLAPGRPVEFGSSYAGYTISMPDGEALVLWSLRGARETRLAVADPRRVEVSTPDGRAIQAKPDLKKRLVTVAIDELPVVVRGGGDDVFPIEAAEDALKQLHTMVAQALAAKLPAETYRYQLDNAINLFKRNPRAAFTLAAESLNGIGALVQPFAWLEAELAEPHSFSEIQLSEAASAGAVLGLNTETRPPAAGYAAQLQFNLPADDSYDIWVACSPPGPQTSPFVWLVDTDDPHSSTEARPAGQTYLGDRMAWLRLGRVPLKRGNHALTLRVTDRATGSGRYALAIDAVVVTRMPFTPSGTTKPPLTAVTDKTVPLPSYDTLHSKPSKKKPK